MELQHSHGHSHSGDLASQTTTRVAIALGLTLAFVVFEALAGVWSNSLALLSDAGHNVTDVVALGLTWYAVRLSLQPANPGKTYGYHRAGILVALVNSTTLVLIALWIFYEAYLRLMASPEVKSGVLIVVGLIAVVVNLATALLVLRGSEKDLNLRSSFVHLMGDVLSSVGAVVAGVIIYLTNWNWLDPLVSVFIGLLILWNAWGILKETVEILLESTPRDIDTSQIIHDLMSVSGVRGVHDLHIWSITQGLRAFSAHILIEDIPISQGAVIQREINEVLSHRYSIGHATLQLECVGCDPDVLYCEMAEDYNHEHNKEKDSVTAH
jgi:cobalt-zinc-cadmium efflux system protein